MDCIPNHFVLISKSQTFIPFPDFFPGFSTIVLQPFHDCFIRSGVDNIINGSGSAYVRIYAHVEAVNSRPVINAKRAQLYEELDGELGEKSQAKNCYVV